MTFYDFNRIIFHLIIIFTLIKHLVKPKHSLFSIFSITSVSYYQNREWIQTIEWFVITIIKIEPKWNYITIILQKVWNYFSLKLWQILWKCCEVLYENWVLIKLNKEWLQNGFRINREKTFQLEVFDDKVITQLSNHKLITSSYTPDSYYLLSQTFLQNKNLTN